MGYELIIKSVLSFIWKYKSIFLTILIISILYFGYQHIKSLNLEIKTTKEEAEVAIKEHDKAIKNYILTNVELKANEEEKVKLEINNKELKKKLEEAMRGKNESWSNTTVPDSIRVLLEKGT